MKKSPIASDESQRINRYFWLIALLHLCIWSSFPLLIRYCTTNDLIEALSWGRQFEWGYDKNPFLVGVLAHLGGLLGRSCFGIYLLQQLFILLGVWAVRQLTFEVSGNRSYAYISATALLLCFCYNFSVQLNNDNYVLQGLLPLSALFFYRATQENHLKHWLYSALCLAIATLAKYSAILMLPLYALYLLFSQHRIKYFLTSKPYIACLFYIFILLPHLIWLYHQDFSAISYAFIERGALNKFTYIQYLHNNLDFLVDTFVEILPALLALLIAIEYKKSADIIFLTQPHSVFKLSVNNRRFFSALLGLVPLILLFLLASILGFLLRTEWIIPFLSFIGTTFFAFFKPAISQSSINRYTVFLVAIMLSIGLGYIIISQKRTTIYYPGPEMAKFSTQLWHARYKTKLAYVAGDRYIAGYIAFYSIDKPQVWMEWNVKKSPWINPNTVRCKGALFVKGHNPGQHFKKETDFPTSLRLQFLTMIDLPIQSFQWHRNYTQQTPVEIHFALLPPDKNFCK